jgi:hypothetical protein
MNKTYGIMGKSFIYTLVLVLALFLPAATFVPVVGAEETEVCVAPSPTESGVRWPVGSDAGTFTYHCDGAYAGKWANAYYVYDPVSNTRTALYSPEFSYDCATNTWSMTEWSYSPAQAQYLKYRVTPSFSPGLETGCPPPAPSPSVAAVDGSEPVATAAGAESTGPGSTNGTSGSLNLSGTSTNNNTYAMRNGVYSQAGTGHTYVIGNTTGGSATSGDAQVISNIANLLQTTSNIFGPDTATFVSNINGDVYGDLLFDPAAITNVGPGSTNTSDNLANITLNSLNNTDAQMTNAIDVGAHTGDATVANNTTGGDATSGDAQAIVNLMNLINSIITSGRSFVGVVNINGNLNGDILLPPDLINQLLASNAPDSTNTSDTTVNANLTATNNLNTAITNNLNTSASSGDATVAENTSAGSATSGNGQTNVTILNLTGSTVIGKNNLLVFVNVLGTWVGLILNAPQGTTAASLGGGVTTNALNLDATLLNNTNLGITNDINAHSSTGDATVARNTSGGSATSGDADTAVNLLNIAGANLNLSDWFGVLFINVFGNWVGSFGVNTEAGNPVVPAVTSGTTGSSGSAPSAGGSTTPATPTPAFVRFVPKATTGSTATPTSATLAASTVANVLGTQSSPKKFATASTPATVSEAKANFWIPAIGIFIALLLLLAERIPSLRRKA